MKKNITFLITILATCFAVAQNVNIPDPNFKDALVNHHLIYKVYDEDDNEIPADVIDTDGDGEISIAEAEAFDGELYCFLKNISDLTGIEAFPNIKLLDCSINNLTTLDVSNHLALKGLDCSINNLTTLDVSNNLDLEALDCSVNNLTTLDVSNNINLWGLGCSYNQITTLDLNNHTDLRLLLCNNNQLTSLNVKNGNNQEFHYDYEDFGGYAFFAHNNPNLVCIEVDNADWSVQNWIFVDSYASFSENCSTSVNDFISSTNFGVYPNPFTDIITITTDKNTIENIEIYDVKGSLLYKNQSNATEINLDLSDFNTGIYFVKISSEQGQTTHKIIKKR